MTFQDRLHALSELDRLAVALAGTRLAFAILEKIDLETGGGESLVKVATTSADQAEEILAEARALAAVRPESAAQ